MSAPPIGCETCFFFSPHPFGEHSKGQCRFRAPKIEIFASQERSRTVWPLVRPDDFCGDHATAEAESPGPEE